MNRVLIVGGSGRVGSQVVHQLPADGVRIRVLARSPGAAWFPAHVEAVYGDLTLPETLDAALHGIDSVFLVWTAPPAAVTRAMERIAGHAQRMVYLSAPIKTPHPLFQQPNAARDLAVRIEQLIENSGLEWTFLRPGMFAANALRWWRPQTRAGDLVRWPYLAAPTAPIDERDIGAVAVRALCEEGHAGAEYVLTGPESLSQFVQISTVGQVIGRPLRIVEQSPDEARRELPDLIDWGKPRPPSAAVAAVIDMLLDAWAAALGQPAFVTSTVAEITGSTARTFHAWAADHAEEFQTGSQC
jgi:uncharacterized protein YbjT (DUF2867 family)